MKHLLFDTQQRTYKVALLIKESAWNKREIETNYIEPLKARGITPSEVIAFSLAYNEHDRAPATFIRERLVGLEKAVKHLQISHLLVADGSYWKVLSKLRKTEPFYGYIKPSIFTGIQCTPTINYQTTFYNPTLKSKIILSIEALAKDINGENGLFQTDLLKQVKFPKTFEEIQQQLQDLHQYPKLTCDIETEGLHLTDIKLVSISFAWSETEGCAFMVRDSDNLLVLLNFLKSYTGTLIYHNAPFDTKGLIYNLFMGFDKNNIKGMLEGLHYLHNNLEDTQILAYLATNSTAGNKLSLKELAFEFTGNYALDDITNIKELGDDTILRYNATDTLATWYVYNKYKPIVEKNQKEIYQDLFKPALKVITQMELVGLPFNPDTVQKTNKELHDICFQHAAAIAVSPIIKQFEKELRLEAVITANSKLKRLRKTTDDFQDLHFNPNSHKQLGELFHVHLELPITRYTDTKQPATDNRAIDGLIAHVKQTYNL